MRTSRSDELVEGALALARGGIPVIPLRPRSKIPLHPRWPDLGLLDEDAIALEWQLNPGANVGALCGPGAFDGHGLVIVDLDPPDGARTWVELKRAHADEPVPSTDVVRTPSGGSHRYFYGRTDSWNPGPGLEVRSTGRQCAAPPSIGANGRRYEWTITSRHGFQPLPRWLVKSPNNRGVGPARPSKVSGLVDPVLEVPPPVYFQKLTGLVPDRAGFVCCPFHGEQVPSLKAYETADRGWFCYGESCRRGGDVVTLVAALAGVPTPVRGLQFAYLLDYLRGRLL